MKNEITEAMLAKDWPACIRLCHEALEDASTDAATRAWVQVTLAQCLIQGNPPTPSHREEAIALCEELLRDTTLTPKKRSWLHSCAAIAYSHRTDTDREESLVSAIFHYEQVLKTPVLDEDHEVRQACVQASAAFRLNELVELSGVEREPRLRKSQTYLRQALTVLTPDRDPEANGQIRSALLWVEDELEGEDSAG
jgi:hypothetical protein